MTPISIYLLKALFLISMMMIEFLPVPKIRRSPGTERPLFFK